MTARDRMVIIGVTLLVVLGAAWIMVVSPERKQAGKQQAQVSAARATLATAQGKVADARTAEQQYAKAYASVVALGKAVPPSGEVPSLIYELSQASNEKRVELTSIASGSSSSSGSSASASASASATPASFTAMPFTFVFEGGFFRLEHLFRQLANLTTLEANGGVHVSGRLLTIQSVKLSPVSSSTTAGGSVLEGTITASAYVLPASESLTAGSSASAPATSPSSSSAGSSTTAPAATILKVNP